ncbi:MAG: hypothetical protein NTX15_11070 [Candidatus Kapabacteria bacterium]|nr:hypothetical protein [Candidatus Kapabacteria bacterium]
MTRSLIAIFVALLTLSPVWAQDEKLDDLSFEEAPLKDEAIPYFAIGVGPVFNFVFASTTDVNAQAKSLGLGEIKAPVFQLGAEIFTAVGVIPNLRLGFSWVSGSATTSANVVVGGTTVNRTLLYGIASRTFHLDYAWVPVKSLAILPGLGFGWGDQRVEMYQSTNEMDWTKLTDTSSFAPAPNAYTALKQNTLYLLPRVNIEYSVTPFLNLRLQAAYTWQFTGSDWVGNQYATVKNVPDNISVSGLNLQFGVFVGLFN